MASVVDIAAHRAAVMLLTCLLGVWASAGCSHARWPDEPGVQVERVLSANVEAGDRFLAALTDRRRAKSLPLPVVAPQNQEEIRAFAAELQDGRITAPQAERLIAAWGEARYAAEVRSFLVDCAAGDAMPLPPELVNLPSAVISYSAAHFRPRSMASDQCAILVVAVVGRQRVEKTKLGT